MLSFLHHSHNIFLFLLRDAMWSVQVAARTNEIVKQTSWQSFKLGFYHLFQQHTEWLSKLALCVWSVLLSIVAQAECKWSTCDSWAFSSLCVRLLPSAVEWNFPAKMKWFPGVQSNPAGKSACMWGKSRTTSCLRASVAFNSGQCWSA